MQKRLIGTTNARLDPLLGQLCLGRGAGLGIVKQPCLNKLPGAGGLDDFINQVWKGRRKGGGENLCHLDVLPVGSRLSRSQSPRRFRPSTVKRMASPGKTDTHQAFCK